MLQADVVSSSMTDHAPRGATAAQGAAGWKHAQAGSVPHLDGGGPGLSQLLASFVEGVGPLHAAAQHQEGPGGQGSSGQGHLCEQECCWE